jgi:hypothetical protein
MPDQAKPGARPWRRFMRFSVRGLIVLVLVSCVGLGWLVRSARIQREAALAITAAGGEVDYNREWTSRQFIPGGNPWAPQWLVKLIGVDYFGHVTLVKFFASSTATDATIERVRRLTGLEELYVTQPSVDDAGLVHLKGLTKLSFLYLVGTRVTDAGVAHLKELANLSGLSLNRNQVNDAGLAHLKELKNLTELDLGFTRVTDAGLIHLKGLTNLSELNLRDTNVTDAGIEQLKQALPKLRITH